MRDEKKTNKAKYIKLFDYNLEKDPLTETIMTKIS